MRHHDWDIRLAEYVRSVRNKPFSWGDHDCITFANNCVKEIQGSGFVDQYLSKYKTPQGALRRLNSCLKKAEFDSLESYLDSVLIRTDTAYPPRGCVAAMPMEEASVLPFALGIAIDQHCVFVGNKGLLFVKPKPDFIFWSID